jgi:hypothetical protein
LIDIGKLETLAKAEEFFNDNFSQI